MILFNPDFYSRVCHTSSALCTMPKCYSGKVDDILHAPGIHRQGKVTGSLLLQLIDNDRMTLILETN